MDFDEYQRFAETSAIYPGAGSGDSAALQYLGLGLASESGETAGKVKKIQRDNGGSVTPETRREIGLELGDVLWYIARMAEELGYSLSSIAEANRNKLQSRKDRGTIQGDGDDR